jgi:hypothetical protein
LQSFCISSNIDMSLLSSLFVIIVIITFFSIKS